MCKSEWLQCKHSLQTITHVRCDCYKWDLYKRGTSISETFLTIFDHFPIN